PHQRLKVWWHQPMAVSLPTGGLELERVDELHAQSATSLIAWALETVEDLAERRAVSTGPRWSTAKTVSSTARINIVCGPGVTGSPHPPAPAPRAGSSGPGPSRSSG